MYKLVYTDDERFIVFGNEYQVARFLNNVNVANRNFRLYRRCKMMNYEGETIMDDMWNSIENDQEQINLSWLSNLPQPVSLSGEMLWEAFREMFPPFSTGSWAVASEDTKDKYNKVANKLNEQLGLQGEYHACSACHDATPEQGLNGKCLHCFLQEK